MRKVYLLQTISDRTVESPFSYGNLVKDHRLNDCQGENIQLRNWETTITRHCNQLCYLRKDRKELLTFVDSLHSDSKASHLRVCDEYKRLRQQLISHKYIMDASKYFVKYSLRSRQVMEAAVIQQVLEEKLMNQG